MKKFKIISLILLMCCGLVLIYPAVIAKKEYDHRAEVCKSYESLISIYDKSNNTLGEKEMAYYKDNKQGAEDCVTAFIFLISLAVVIEAIGAVNLYLTFKKA